MMQWSSDVHIDETFPCIRNASFAKFNVLCTISNKLSFSADIDWYGSFDIWDLATTCGTFTPINDNLNLVF